jgi:glycosyltransferase involved in cell wall biosynthesis
MAGEARLLTVAVPSYNAEKTLRRCLDSLLEPRVLSRLEVIIIDDGSRDRTGAIADDYAHRYPASFRVVHQENGGHGSGINAAVRLARGKYFKVLDADDALVTGNLEAFVAALDTTNVDVVLTHFYAQNIRNGKKRLYRTGGIRLNRDYTFTDFWAAGKGVRASCRFHGICYRTDFYRSCRLTLSERVFYEDQEYATLPFQWVRTILPLDMFLYEYTIGETGQSVSNTNKVRYIYQIERVLWLLWEHYRKASGLSPVAADYFKYKMSHVLFSYYAAALLMNPDRKEGRAQARALGNKARGEAKELYRAVRLRYWGVLALHYAGITWSHLVAIQHTLVYRLLFRVVS